MACCRAQYHQFLAVRRPHHQLVYFTLQSNLNCCFTMHVCQCACSKGTYPLSRAVPAVSGAIGTSASN
eukprot:5910-Heterococcus_DN1.PRE.2